MNIIVMKKKIRTRVIMITSQGWWGPRLGWSRTTSQPRRGPITIHWIKNNNVHHCNDDKLDVTSTMMTIAIGKQYKKKTSRSRRTSWWGKGSRQWQWQTTSQLGRRPSWRTTYFERSLKKFEAILLTSFTFSLVKFIEHLVNKLRIRITYTNSHTSIHTTKHTYSKLLQKGLQAWSLWILQIQLTHPKFFNHPFFFTSLQKLLFQSSFYLLKGLP